MGCFLFASPLLPILGSKQQEGYIEVAYADVVKKQFTVTTAKM
jgi:hypothetical protein